ncbi:MAG: hypothetical protein ACLQNE_17820 [Thermoguttaceae bacterium]
MPTRAGTALLERLTIRQRPGVKTFRSWQEGLGYDRNLVKRSTIFAYHRMRDSPGGFHILGPSPLP